MRAFIILLAVLLTASAHAQTIWNHNGSDVELTSDGPTRVITYLQPRYGLPVTRGTVLFRGTANGSRYSGTAYVFSSRCGAYGYAVSGDVNVPQKSIILYGEAPAIDSSCNVIGLRDDVLVFSFDNCGGCICGDEFELSAIYPPKPAPGSTEAEEGTSCPYLFAWSDRNQRWDSYGKVIHAARGPRREMTQAIALFTFATRFRLSEKEPERSFINQVLLYVDLKNGAHLILKPTTRSLQERDRKRVYIHAFGAVEFSFKLPIYIKRDRIAKSSLYLTGYYESVYSQRICRANNRVSGK